MFDDAYSLNANPLADIRFHRADATETDDILLQWEQPPQPASASSQLSQI